MKRTRKPPSPWANVITYQGACKHCDWKVTLRGPMADPHVDEALGVLRRAIAAHKETCEPAKAAREQAAAEPLEAAP